MNFKTIVAGGKEIQYFVNDNGANIELVKIEPNQFYWWNFYCTIDLYINIYNDDFTKKVSFRVVNFSTGIEGGSWFEEADEEDENYREPTEEAAWAETLAYFAVDDPYEALEHKKELWNSFDKYMELLEESPLAMYHAMINDEMVKKCCSCGHLDNEGGVFDFTVITPKHEEVYDWEGCYKDNEDRYVEIPVKIGLNSSGTERKIVKMLSIDTLFLDEYLEKSGPNEILNMDEKTDYNELNVFMGEWLTTLWGCAKKGKLIGDYCLGGYDLPDWEGESTLGLLGFWKLTDIKRLKIKDREYTVFYSGAKYWVIDDEKADTEEDFYPLFFTDAKDCPNVIASIEGKINFPDNSEESIEFSVELSAIENNIIEHYYKYAEKWEYFPEDLYHKLVNHLQTAYLAQVKGRPNAIQSLDELNALECRYSFPKMED